MVWKDCWRFFLFVNRTFLSWLSGGVQTIQFSGEHLRCPDLIYIEKNIASGSSIFCQHILPTIHTSKNMNKTHILGRLSSCSFWSISISVTKIGQSIKFVVMFTRSEQYISKRELIMYVYQLPLVGSLIS